MESPAGTPAPFWRKGAAPVFNRTPFGIVLIAVLLGLTGFFAAVSGVTPWFSESGTIPGHPFHSAFTVDFAPGPDGYVVTCVIVITTSNCLTTPYAYGDGHGTALLTGLYLGLLGAVIAVAAITFAAIGLLLAGVFGRLRARRARELVILLLLVALVIVAAAAIAQPFLQAPALRDSNACAGFNGSASPCTSLTGSAGGVACQNSSCAETNVTWYPAEGWYFAITSAGVGVVALLALRFQPFGSACPTCGVENSFRREFCVSCGDALPARPKKRYSPIRQ